MTTTKDIRVLTRLDAHRESVTLPGAISAAERTAWCQWLQAHGIDPAWVVQGDPITVDDEQRLITVWLYDHDDDGHLIYHAPSGHAHRTLHRQQLEARPLPWPDLPAGVRYLSTTPPTAQTRNRSQGLGQP